MRTIPKEKVRRGVSAALFAVLVLALLAACLPGRVELVHTEVSALDGGDSRQAAVLAALEDLDAQYGPVSVVQKPHLLLPDETWILVPYLGLSVRDVGTAGGADWGVFPSLLALAWRGEEAAEPRAVTLEPSVLRAEADENTWFFSEDAHMLEESLPALTWKDAEGGDLRHALTFSAVTLDSTQEADKDCLCRCVWEGAWSLRTGWNKTVEVAFSIEASAAYLGNVR